MTGLTPVETATGTAGVLTGGTVLGAGEMLAEGGAIALEVSNPIGWAVLAGTGLYLGWKWYQHANEQADGQGAQAPPAATCDCPTSTPADPNQQGPEDEQKKKADARSAAGREPDRGGLTKAGRALAKHGGRQGSAFPRASGGPAEINEQGQKIVDDIVRDPQATEKPNRFGGSDVTAPDGRGVRFGGDGSMMGLLEP